MSTAQVAFEALVKLKVGAHTGPFVQKKLPFTRRAARGFCLAD